MTALLILIASGVLMVDARLRTSLGAYVVFSAATLSLIYPDAVKTPDGLMIFVVLTLIKIVAGPVLIMQLVRRAHLREYLSPAFPVSVRLAVVVLAVFLGYGVGHMVAFVGIPDANLVFYCLFASMCIVMLHRSLLAHVIGLLTLGSAISLAGAVFAPSLPGAIDLAGTFDAILATIVAISVARALARHDPKLDIRSLRELRG